MFVLEIIPHKGAYDSDTLVKLLFWSSILVVLWHTCPEDVNDTL